MSGGYGGGRGSGGQGADGAGYGGYDDERGPGERGAGERGRARRRPGPRPEWDDPAARPQPGGQPAQPPGYGRGPDYGQDPDYGQPDRGQGYGQPNGRPGPRGQARRPDSGGQGRYRPAAGAQPGLGGGSQQPPRGSGPQPGDRGRGGRGGPQQARPQQARPQQSQYGSGPQPVQPGQPGGGQQGWPGSGAQQAPRGYDPRGTAARRAAADGYPAEGYPAGGYQPGGYPADGYPARGDARFSQGSHDGWDEGDSPFLPGFGGREESDGPRRGGRYADADDDYGDTRRDRKGRDDRGGRGGRDDGDGRRPRRGPVRRLAPWIALLVIVVPLLLVVYHFYNLYQSRYHPADYAGAGTAPAVTVQVKSGDTATSLAPRLVSLGVVASSRAFVLAAEHSTNTTGLESGFYKLSHHMRASLAFAALLNPKNRVQLTLTFPEGLRLSQIVTLLGTRSGMPASDYQQVLRDPAQLGLPAYAKGKPEGYLFPATYQIQPNDTALTVLKAMVRKFDQEAAQLKLTAAAAKVHLTPAQLIVVASLVQAEGGRLQDYPKIAEVVYNRLARGMQLKFDSTVFYGLGKYGTAATFAEINTPGPYNTYLNKGLPPGPIDSPGAAAIKAALHPATGNLLYFFGFKNGVTEFSPNPIAH